VPTAQGRVASALDPVSRSAKLWSGRQAEVEEFLRTTPIEELEVFPW